MDDFLKEDHLYECIFPDIEEFPDIMATWVVPSMFSPPLSPPNVNHIDYKDTLVEAEADYLLLWEEIKATRRWSEVPSPCSRQGKLYDHNAALNHAYYHLGFSPDQYK